VGFVLTCGVGCDNAEGGSESLVQSSPGETGSVSLALTTQGGVTFDSFNYSITGPSFTKSAPIGIQNSTTVSAVIGGIPVGTGYTIALTGESQSPKANCSGSAAFSVSAGAVTPVPIAIACRVEQAGSGGQSGTGGNAGTGGGGGGSGTTPVPIPPFAPALLGSILLAIGARRALRRS
jgi:hypothetical protein